MKFLWIKKGLKFTVSFREAFFKVSVEANKTQEKQSHGLSVDGGGCDSTAFVGESLFQGWPVPVIHMLYMEF